MPGFAVSDSTKTTLREVASEAGVAESTASRALADHPGIAEDTRTRVREAARHLGYRKSRKTMSGTAERRGLVGVVVGALHNAFYPYLANRIHDELDALGYGMMLIVDELSDSGSGRKLKPLVDTALDGVIIATASIGSPAVDLLVERRIPTVLAIRSNKRGNVDVVESDNHMTGTEAMRHLLELGHRRIAFILGPKNTSTSLDRYTGCMAELGASGIRPDEAHIVWGAYSHDAGYSGVIQLVNLPDPPTAVFCANDIIAIGALDACRKLDFSVPEDISIIGVGDIPMADWSMIALTTMRRSMREIGTLAARRIVMRIEGRQDSSASHIILPTSIVLRRTTAPPGKGKS